MIKKYVQSYVDLYYPKNDDFTDDKHLKAFRDEIAVSLGIDPILTKRGLLMY